MTITTMLNARLSGLSSCVCANSSQPREAVTKRSIFSVISLLALLCVQVIAGCGGGSSSSNPPPPPPPSPVTHFSVTAPANASAAKALNFMVAALDASNNVVPSYSGTAHFTSSDAQAVLPANSALTNGTGNFSATLETPGGQTITATDTVTPSITGTSNLITVSGPATHFSVTVPVAATVGIPFNFTVTALDALNDPAASYSGTVHFTSSDAGAVLPANSPLTNGVGIFSATLITVGSENITGTDTVTASIFGTSFAISVTGPATHLSVTAPAAATVGMPFSIIVISQDALNNTAAGYTGTVRFTSTDAQALLPANSTLTNGVGTFSVTLRTLGSQTIEATDIVTASITGSSNSITVGTNSATHASVIAPGGVIVGTEFNFTVTALDAANNVSTNYSGTMHFTSTDAKAVLPANSTLTNGKQSLSATLNTTGAQSITATDTITSSITGTSSLIAVFVTCAKAGQQCPPDHPCCVGLDCVLEGNRDYCVDPRASGHASRFRVACKMERPRESHVITLLNNGMVLITGGDDENVSLSTAELFNPASRSFAPTGDMVVARVRHTATLLGNGAVLVIGGRDASGNALAAAELFNPANLSFAPGGNLSTPRESHTATLLRNGKVLIAGGDNGTVSLETAELFDPAIGSFALTGSMGAPRDFQTATLLKNGKVLVTGGRDANGNVLATAELYDPTSRTFTWTGNLNTPRESHTATLLSNGKVLITGGDNGTITLATAELFDPISGKFTPTGTMHAVREFHTATLRNDGTVLVTGGADLAFAADGGIQPQFVAEPTVMAELFDPASGAFTRTSDMANARARHAAILLPDGQVLVTGGINDSARTDSLESAELFQ